MVSTYYNKTDPEKIFSSGSENFIKTLDKIKQMCYNNYGTYVRILLEVKISVFHKAVIVFELYAVGTFFQAVQRIIIGQYKAFVPFGHGGDGKLGVKLLALFQLHLLIFVVFQAVKSAVALEGNGSVGIVHHSYGYLSVAGALCFGLHCRAFKGGNELKLTGESRAE